ncbi:hypothetical protein AB0903_21670 [Streptomyces sp. NPDC048389]|uniref:hypothetical protein n=1 Tax=Streptomyces sp. NPDC048389 TaxID=3154622 RepID=UPI0034556288
MNNGPADEPKDLPVSDAGEDEDALRRLLHGAVQNIQPSAEALDHLRRAVPARRARKRQALVGVAAAALLIGTAVPAFIHVANSGSSDSADPVNAGHDQQAKGGTGNDPGVTGGDNGVKGPTQGAGNAVVPGRTTGPDLSAEAPTGGSDGASGAVQTPAAKAKPCDPGQLTVATELSAPDAEGKAYGTFRVTNVSDTDCFVGGSTVGFRAMGAADPSRIGVARHTAGDAASGLPDPMATETDTAVARAATVYQVRFAWVPSDTCPTEAPSPAPSSSGGDASGGTDTTGGGAGGVGGQDGTSTSEGNDAEPQLLTEDGTQDGSVAVTYSALNGMVSGRTNIPDACAGTIYYTGVLAGQ